MRSWPESRPFWIFFYCAVYGIKSIRFFVRYKYQLSRGDDGNGSVSASRSSINGVRLNRICFPSNLYDLNEGVLLANAKERI